MPPKATAPIVVDEEAVKAEASRKAHNDRLMLQLAAIEDQEKDIAAKKAAVIAEIPPVPVDPKKPETWPWGVKVKAHRLGFYPERGNLALTFERKPGSVFEVAHQGHFTEEWMMLPDGEMPRPTDESIPITTAPNQVRNADIMAQVVVKERIAVQ